MAVGFRLVPRRGLFLLVLLAIGLGTLATAQQDQSGLLAVTTAPAYDNADFKIVKRVDEVNLRFTVTDSHGHFQNQLTAEDFQVLDNHQPPAAIRYFQQQSTLPMRVGILIDVSASIATRFKFEQKAASVFLQKALRPGYDEAFVVTFDQKVHLLEDWTSDPKAAFDKVHALHAGGNTALYDAVIFACDKLRRRTADVITRPVIILITDGDDNSSKSLLYDAQQAAARAGPFSSHSAPTLSARTTTPKEKQCWNCYRAQPADAFCQLKVTHNWDTPSRKSSTPCGVNTSLAISRRSSNSTAVFAQSKSTPANPICRCTADVATMPRWRLRPSRLSDRTITSTTAWWILGHNPSSQDWESASSQRREIVWWNFRVGIY